VHTKPRNYTKHKQVEARLKEQKRKRKKQKKNKMPNLERFGRFRCWNKQVPG